MAFRKKIVSAITLMYLICFIPYNYAENYLNFSNNVTHLELYENFQVRQRYREIIFTSLYHARNTKERICIQQDFTHRVTFKVVEKNNALFYLFLNERKTEYPMTGRGNVSIKRSLENNRILNMTVMIRDHNGCYIRLTPYKERTLLDLFLFGTRVYHNVLIPLSLQKLVLEPVAKIVELTGGIIDWDLVLYRGSDNDGEEGIKIFEKIRKMLPQLHTTDDGARSKDGEYVFIRDLRPQPEPGGFNCSGFAKWIIDGFYYPLKGEYTQIEVLKEKRLEYRGNRWSLWYEDERDPYFGLDWTRNLAVELYRARNRINNVDPETFDVRDIRFLEYVEDVGYPLYNTELILFLCTFYNPNYFYLGSVNQTFKNIHQHYHIAVFFPYFTDEGALKIIIMEKNKETTLPAFLDNYQNSYLHLVRIDIRGKFDPLLP